MACTIVVGGQWGDEAKGKITSYLALTDGVEVAARAGLGPGAGHTVVLENRELRFRQVPSAVVNPKTRLLLGAGVLVRPDVVLREIQEHGLQERIGIDWRATVIESQHVQRDVGDPHLSGVVQSTGSGHGPSLADRAMRTASRAVDVEELASYLTDVAQELNAACDDGREVLIEGTNGFLLSVLYGTYPHVVGKDSTASTAAADVGIGPLRVDEVILVFKSFPTRVGAGDFPTEFDVAEADKRGFIEHGTVTGRRRRVGEFDFELARQAVRVNQPSYLALTFLDRIDPECRGGKLTSKVESFVDRIEDELNCPVLLLGTGPDTFDIVDRRRTAEGAKK